MVHRCTILAVILVTISPVILAQEVGLVLSGGGAKGLAHIGVLKALEENEIPIDNIVGTSMGGIIGGYYAAGFSAHEIEEIALSGEFQNWVNGRFSDKYNYHFSQRDDNPSILTINLALDSTLTASWQTTLANDLFINFVLAEMLAQASQVAKGDFNQLFVPYRAVAADIFTQTDVTLKSGELSEAVRTTFTVPFFYRPIEVNDKYLFDGGIYNNFPVNVARDEFQPDVIIGSNVSTKTYNEYPHEVDEQLINNSLLLSLIDNSNPESLYDSDIYIQPELKGYSAIDFSKVKSIIDSGYYTTLRQMPELQSRISRRQSKEQLNRKREVFKSKMKSLRFSPVSYEGFTASQQKYLKSLFKPKGDFLTIEEIRKGYFRLISEEYFSDIVPRITYDVSSESFQLQLRQKPKKTIRLELGGNISSRSVSSIFLGARFYHLNRALFDHSFNFNTGSFYQSVRLKSRISIPGGSHFYVEPEFTFNHWDYIDFDDFVQETKPTIIDEIDRKYALNIGLPVGTHFKLKLQGGLVNNRYRFGNNPVFLSSDTLDLLKIDGTRVGMSFSRNTLNAKQYPKSGGSLNLSLDYFDLREQYFPGNTSVLSGNDAENHSWYRLKLEAEQYFLMGQYSTGYFLKTIISNQTFLSNYNGSLIASPSFSPLPDSHSLFLQNFRAHNSVAVGVRNVISLRNNLDFRLEGYIFKAFKRIVESEPQVPAYNGDLKSIFLVGSANTVFHSPFGPISLSVNYYDDDETRLGVLLHIGYLLFNNRSLD